MQSAEASSGSAAMEEMLRAARSGIPFRLVLLDGMMPGTDGFMVVERIREHEELSDATVMMLTSAMSAGAAARCAELGVAAHLMKPVSQPDLLEAILVAIGAAIESQPGRDAAPISVAPRGYASCLLRTTPSIARWPRPSLRVHSLVQAANGRKAVEAAARETFDLIFMDVQMPEMDGFEATSRIRAAEQASRHRTSDHCHDRARDGRRPRALPRCGDGRLPFETLG